MKITLKYLAAVSLLLFVLTGIIQAQNYPIITKIESYTSYIRLYLDWGSVSGSDTYSVYRSSGGSEVYTLVGEVKQGNPYFEDKKDLYKTVDQFFKYKVVGPRSESNIETVRYSSPSSTAKRTWGSIKAMFR